MSLGGRSPSRAHSSRGLNNASGYIGLVPARRLGIVLLANRGEYPHEIARYKILPALTQLIAAR